MKDAVSPTQGRVCVLLAAVLWSTSGGFSKLLTKQTPLGLHEPTIDALPLAFWRVLFAGLALLPLLRVRDVGFRPAMLATATSFAVMNALFVSALAWGTAANAIWLQYTAPVWMYLAGIWFLRERRERRSEITLAVVLVGIGVIVAGGMGEGNLPVIAIALGSGVTYAGVVLGLRLTRDVSSRWLTVFNLLFSALALLPFVWGTPLPTGPQLIVLVLFGSCQLALPYWLMARGLRTISAAEAGTLTLIEPLLNPVWAFLTAGETPSAFTLIGGGFILGALAYRYFPRVPKE